MSPLALACTLALTLAPQDPAEAVPAPPAASSSPVPEDLAAVEAQGVQVLLELQEDYERSEPGRRGAPELKGEPVLREWPYEGVYREQRRIPPGYRVGGTSICAHAVLESRAYGEHAPSQAAVAGALDFVLEHLQVPAMGLGFSRSYDVRGWGQAYALEFLLRLRALEAVPEGRSEEVDAAVTSLVDILEATALKAGGWNYSRRGANADASPFMTAPTLMALWEAQAQGEEVDEAVLTRALDALEASRHEDGSIPYSVRGKAGGFMHAKPGAMGRMAVTEVVLLHAGRSTPARVEDAVQTFFEHWDQLEVRRRKTGTHIQPYGVAPYYVFFAYRYVALGIQHLPRHLRKKYRALFLEHLFRVQEESGGWNDRVFPRSENYGTAMALLALRQPDLPLPRGPLTRR